MSNDKEKGVEILISKLKINDDVEINGLKYIYKGQQIVKHKGFKSSKYVFDCVSVKDYQKLFEINASIKFLKFKNDKIILKL